MQELEDTEISGKASDVKRIKNTFGYLKIGRLDPFKREPISLLLAKVLPNFYRTSKATVRTAPLYVLVPNYEIGCVWPEIGNLGNFDDFRYGCASASNGGKLIVNAIAVHKGRIGIYICLHPLNTTEIDKIEFGLLGI